MKGVERSGAEYQIILRGQVGEGGTRPERDEVTVLGGWEGVGVGL
jgi:hypothetical protein